MQPDWTAIMAAMGKNFSEFVTRQQSTLAAHTPLNGSAFPAPEAARFSELHQQWLESQHRLWQAFAQRKPDDGPAPAVVQSDPTDRRFRAPEWTKSPYFDYLRQAYLLNAQFMRACVEATPVADGRAKDRMRYLSKQMIEAMSPANFAATNPEFVETALRTEGESIRRGLENLLRDLQQGHISMSAPGAFEVGRNLAVTEGSVVFENELIQLIQYAPTTDKVHAKPLLIVPPCINKYYLMDLQPENSLVRFLVEQGITVFLISWRNPDQTLAQLTWDDYLRLGPLTALDVVRDISGDAQPNTMGFCVGGTILASALAVACGRGEKPAASMTLLTTLLDFSDAGEIGCLVDEGMVAAREHTIGRGGLLPGRELAQTFSSLRPNDLIWNYVVGNYLKGETPPAFDILHWNCDSTNLPGPFLAWYLRNLYLENSLRVPGKTRNAGRQGGSGQGGHAGLPAGHVGRPHRAVDRCLSGAQAARRRHHLRAGCQRPRGRRDQSGVEGQALALGWRQRIDRRGMAGKCRRTAGQLVEALHQVADCEVRQEGRAPVTSGQRAIQGDRARTRALCERQRNELNAWQPHEGGCGRHTLD
ncbi:MAG: alpha/beta fold hydrolase [Methyloversatilis sp.]|uniref:PHA/PHB synthase family protein n=1 Tax=Methyloversatilis sp. TaxID=2569862 RepID=UPI0025E05B84|nr:alpha/beta fold hydrolase [Methyloversatilis sp.]MCR6667054.1 alpha/beta fold hydrolase [Methyloversatilis sp.]